MSDLNERVASELEGVTFFEGGGCTLPLRHQGANPNHLYLLQKAADRIAELEQLMGVHDQAETYLQGRIEELESHFSMPSGKIPLPAGPDRMSRERLEDCDGHDCTCEFDEDESWFTDPDEGAR